MLEALGGVLGDGVLKQRVGKFKASVGYIARHCFKNK